MSGRCFDRPAAGRHNSLIDGQYIEAVKVSAVLVNVTPGLVEEPVLIGTTGDDGDTDYMSLMVWQVLLGDDLSMKEEVVPGVDCCDSVVGGPTSAFLDSAVGFVDLAGGVTIGVTSLADAGVASPADLAGGVTVGVASPADAAVASLADLAGGDNIRVTSLANAGVASLADAGVASLADAGVSSLAVAEVASSADLAGNVTVGVTFLVDDFDDYCDDSPGY